ncbi:hypothetical protein IEO21_10206 [Rhodonia placenta]|uniref:Uncharacterized protein n=1 Tax=Rhodonia placenta TaxID=104341 RepID=A0A8H7TXN0_9APHY|nr:hypothetical protein IEO21_10206 [Postia placenta]
MPARRARRRQNAYLSHARRGHSPPGSSCARPGSFLGERYLRTRCPARHSRVVPLDTATTRCPHAQ